MSKEYQMPWVDQGMVVNWYPHGDASAEPLPALVTRVADQTLCVSIIQTNTYNLVIRDGVRHLSDPRRKTPELMECGAWDYTPWTKRLLTVEQQMAALLAKGGK